METHPRIDQLRPREYVRGLSRTLRLLERDLDTLGIVDYELRLQESERPRGFRARLNSLGVHHLALVLSSTFDGRSFDVIVPQPVWKGLPFLVEIVLDVAIDFVAAYGPKWFGTGWRIVGDDRTLPDSLRRFRMPKIVGATYNHTKLMGFDYSFIAPFNEDAQRTLWSTQSRSHGAVFRVGPRLLPYLLAAPDLEATLSRLSG